MIIAVETMNEPNPNRSPTWVEGSGSTAMIGKTWPMPHEGLWRTQLANLLAESSKGGVVIVGMGHPLKSDDFVGSLIAKDLARKIGSTGAVKIVDVEDSPENIPHTLTETEPELLILIDSLDAGSSPGSIFLVDLNLISNSFFTTHNIPVQLIFGVASKFRRTVLLGVQPRTLDVGGQLSKEAQGARVKVVKELVELLNMLRGRDIAS